MKQNTLLFLRASVGLLVLLWGIDKVVDVDHALRVSDRFYLGLFSSALLLQVWGVFQSIVGALTIGGLYRRWIYPLVIAINGVSMLGVWRSVVDPWGWVLEGTNVLFFPSLITFAATVLLWAFQEEDGIALDRRIGRQEADGRRTASREAAADGHRGRPVDVK